MINLTIDGKKIEVEEGTTVLKAAEELGIRIPTLCYFKALAPESACRLCVVEVVGGARRGLSASCSYVVEEGLEDRSALFYLNLFTINREINHLPYALFL